MDRVTYLIKRYGKFLVSVAAGAAGAAVMYLSDDKITTTEWLLIVLAGLGAVGVVATPNAPKKPASTEQSPQ